MSIRQDSESLHMYRSLRIPSQRVTGCIHVVRKPALTNAIRSPEVPFDRMTVSTHGIRHRKLYANDHCAGSLLLHEGSQPEFSILL